MLRKIDWKTLIYGGAYAALMLSATLASDSSTGEILAGGLLAIVGCGGILMLANLYLNIQGRTHWWVPPSLLVAAWLMQACPSILIGDDGPFYVWGVGLIPPIYALLQITWMQVTYVLREYRNKDYSPTSLIETGEQFEREEVRP